MSKSVRGTAGSTVSGNCAPNAAVLIYSHLISGTTCGTPTGEDAESLGMAALFGQWYLNEATHVSGNVFLNILSGTPSLHDIGARSITFDSRAFSVLTLADENAANEKRLDQLRRTFSARLIGSIRDEDFEYGVDTKADAMVREQMKLNKLATKSWLNSLFVENFEDTAILTGLLHIVARLEYLEVYPEGQTMALAALSHSDLRVQECGIRAFESWASVESLGVLENVSVCSEWLAEYLSQVVSDLRKEHGVAAG